MSEPELLIITPEQLKAGWFEKIGMTAFQRQYVVIDQTENGNYIVRAPKLKAIREGR